MYVQEPAPGAVPIAYLDLAVRLLLACVFGAGVGVEREIRHKNAGVRTHALVSVGAATFALVSMLGLGPTNNPMLIAAGVVSGIGFIGGGVILRRGGTVQGIATAATLWATGGMGLAVGAGYCVLASLVFLTVLIIQFPLWWLEQAIQPRGPQPSSPPEGGGGTTA